MLQTSAFELELRDSVPHLFEPDVQITDRGVALGELVAHLVELRVETDHGVTFGPARQPLLDGLDHVRAST